MILFLLEYFWNLFLNILRPISKRSKSKACTALGAQRKRQLDHSMENVQLTEWLACRPAVKLRLYHLVARIRLGKLRSAFGSARRTRGGSARLRRSCLLGKQHVGHHHPWLLLVALAWENLKKRASATHAFHSPRVVTCCSLSLSLFEPGAGFE